MENITISEKDSQREKILQDLVGGKINGSEAARQMGVGVRQVRRMKSRYEQEGLKGILHKGRGKVSNHALRKDTKEIIIKKLHEQYPDFGATLASEVLAERDGIRVGKETIRQIQIAQGLHRPRKAKERRCIEAGGFLEHTKENWCSLMDHMSGGLKRDAQSVVCLQPLMMQQEG